MTISHWQRLHSYNSHDLTCDVLILGGGFAGLSTAYWLSEYSPDLKIIVLEKDSCGSGASGRNAGFLTKGSAFFYHSLVKKWGSEKALEIFKFAETSLKLMQSEIFSTSPELKLEKANSLTLTRSENSEIQTSLSGFDFHWKNKSLIPSSLSHSFIGGWETGSEFKINPMDLIRSLKNKLELRKVKIIENSEAFEQTTIGVRTDLNFIRAPITIMAMNGYTSEFDHSFEKSIFPRRAQMLAFEMDSKEICPDLYYDPAERVYFRHIQGKLWAIGGKRLADEQNEVGVLEKVNPLIQSELEKYLSEVLKFNFKVTERWSGIMGFTSSELPFVTKLKSKSELYLIGGFSGHGMGFGFHSAKEMAELVLHKINKSFFQQFTNE